MYAISRILCAGERVDDGPRIIDVVLDVSLIVTVHGKSSRVEGDARYRCPKIVQGASPRRNCHWSGKVESTSVHIWLNLVSLSSATS